MKIKTISYKRVLNLGNYENKHLELFAEVEEGEDAELAILSLADTVERTIRESVNKEYNRQMLQLEVQKEKLAEEVANLKYKLKKLGKIKDEPPSPADDIPIDGGVSEQAAEDTLGGF